MILFININEKQHQIKKIQQVLGSIGLDNVDIYLRDGLLNFDIEIVNSHPIKGTDWITYLDKNCFVSYGCPPSQNLSKIIIKRNWYCLYSEKRTQGLTSKRDSYCAAYCLYKNYWTKTVGIHFYSAVRKWYYQTIS